MEQHEYLTNGCAKCRYWADNDYVLGCISNHPESCRYIKLRVQDVRKEGLKNVTGK